MVPPIIGYLRAVRSHLFLCLAIVLAAAVGAVGWMATHPPEYEASSQLLVTPLGEGDSSFLGLPIIRAQGADPQRAVVTAATLAESGEVVALTAERLGDRSSPAAIEAAVEIVPNEDENIVEVSATADDSSRAATIADVYAQSVLVARQAELEPLIAKAIRRAEAELETLADADSLRATELQARLSDLRFIDDGADPTLAVAQLASVPTAPSGPPRWLIFAIALVAGVAIAAVTAILIEVLAPGSIDNEDDLQRGYPLPVLARVPRSTRRLRGARRGFELPIEEREAFRTLRGQLELRQVDRGGRGSRTATGDRLSGVIAITSPMTGDGKTSAAIALGQVAAATGADATILETDLRKPDLARRLGVEPDLDLTALMAPGASLESVAATFPGSGGTRFVAAPRIDSIAMIERLGSFLPKLLTESANDGACVVVDTAALGEVSDSLLILPAADQVVIAVRLYHTSHGALASLRDSLERSGVRPAGFVIFDSPLAAGSASYTSPRRLFRRR